MSGVGMRTYELAASAGDNLPALGTRKPCPEGFLLPSVTWRHSANTSSPTQITCNPGFPLRGHLYCWPPAPAHIHAVGCWLTGPGLYLQRVAPCLTRNCTSALVWANQRTSLISGLNSARSELLTWEGGSFPWILPLSSRVSYWISLYPIIPCLSNLNNSLY